MIFETRRANLSALVGGDVVGFSAKHNLNADYIRQLLKDGRGSRSIGEKSAARLEEKIGLQPGELSREREQGVDMQPRLSTRQRRLLELFESLPNSRQDEIIVQLEAENKHYEQLLSELLAKRKSA
jgi:hypothetical protein